MEIQDLAVLHTIIITLKTLFFIEHCFIEDEYFTLKNETSQKIGRVKSKFLAFGHIKNFSF